jgi:hypothetical protein
VAQTISCVVFSHYILKLWYLLIVACTFLSHIELVQVITFETNLFKLATYNLSYKNFDC